LQHNYFLFFFILSGSILREEGTAETTEWLEEEKEEWK
jgi:hypothetical protein